MKGMRAIALLKGKIKVPGDKSISHRAIIVASLADGASSINNLCYGEDVQRTIECLHKLGVKISIKENGTYVVYGVGIGNFTKPTSSIYLGNSGTSARVMIGVLSTYKFSVTILGDKSLASRPMDRVMNPLKEFGAEFEAKDSKFLPITIKGISKLNLCDYTYNGRSAQVKTSIILAALGSEGEMTITEKIKSRNHTEIMLKQFGAAITVNGNKITIKGNIQFNAYDITIPGDPSSAAFLAVAAIILPGSDIMIEGVCINPMRTGLYTTLIEMGARIDFLSKRLLHGEEVADIRVRHSDLRGVVVPQDRSVSMIDEYPILCIAAAYATGKTIMNGVEELRYKESDRIASMANGLKICGIEIEEYDNKLIVIGSNGKISGGAVVKTSLDHRVAMSFMVLDLISEKCINVDDEAIVNTSFPNFKEILDELKEENENYSHRRAI